jgi:hypothetical protein
VSLDTAIARIQAIQSAFAPPAPAAAPQPTATSGGSFAGQLQQAMAPASATAPAPAPAGTFSHLDGDLDANPELLRRLDALAAQKGMHFHITSGLRTRSEQQALWDARGSNPYPVAQPGTSRHESGNAADVTINGQAIQSVISAAELQAAGIAPLSGDAVHVELPH